MRGIIRLIEGLINGDPDTIYILAFAIGGTIILYAAVEIYRKLKKL